MNLRARLVGLWLVALPGCESEPAPEPHEPAMDPALQAPPEGRLPAHPKRFRIELTSGPCFGDCPTYRMSLDQDGLVGFVGEMCLARPGVWPGQVEAEDARAVYDALMDAGFAELGDRYVSEEDGCRIATDASTTFWRVIADGKKKTLKHYHGCEGVPGLDDVDAVRPLLLRRAGLRERLAPLKSCDEERNRIPDATLRVSYEGEALGVLEIKTMYEAPRYFELRDCAGEVVAQGDAHTERGRVVLLDADRGALALPGALGEAASLLLEFGETDARAFHEPVLPTSALALRDDQDIELELSPGSACK